MAPYRTAMLDWLACAFAGRREPAARAARALGDGLAERVAAAATAGHVLDFDDTYARGLAHLSAPTAPAALLVGAQVGATIGAVIEAYAEGFEAMGALTARNHPRLRERGWHPTAVCGSVGAAVAAARLLELDDERRTHAIRLSLVQAGGLQGAFGSDGKSLQVGLSAAAGVTAARLAAAGARVAREVVDGPGGFEQAFGGRWVTPEAAAGIEDGSRAVHENWIKAYPCCLQTHAPIEAAARVRETLGVPREAVTVVVHPISRQAADRDDVETGLEAKFSIPYLTAFTLLHGPPRVESLRSVDAEARSLAARSVAVRTDAALRESAAVIEIGGRPAASIEAALGSPARPMDERALAAKVEALAGHALAGLLDDPGRSARSVVEAAALIESPTA